ncbi:WAT1-related protein At5g64700 [Rosa chinensis]|uniref:WAT1-related protein At5g64700 n=1 Tax=Rosa chinensis TaxID=74649 RepID=UPI001AD8DDC0|nr:WAT1-related protein At5g64700 [Rosa chinensis]
MEAGRSSSRKPYLVVTVIQTIYAGMFLLSKAALNGGMNTYVFVFYRQAAATLFLVPLALFLEWKTAPPLSFMTFFKIFLLSFFGITVSLDFCGVGLLYTSATLYAAIRNSLPVITFLLAVLLRMEVLKLRTTSGVAKLAGILFCTAGVVTLAVYKGPHLNLLGHHNLFHHHNIQEHEGHVPSGKTWIEGCFLVLMGHIFWGLWLVLQAGVMKSYPSMLLFTTLQCFLSSIQTFVIAIAVERNPYQWKLGWNLKLVAVAYCVILSSHNLISYCGLVLEFNW